MMSVLVAPLRHAWMSLVLALLCGCAGHPTPNSYPNSTPNPYPNNLMQMMLKRDPAWAARITKCQQAGLIFTAGLRDDGVLIVTIQAPPDKFIRLQNECLRDFPRPDIRSSVEFRVEPAAAVGDAERPHP